MEVRITLRDDDFEVLHGNSDELLRWLVRNGVLTLVMVSVFVIPFATLDLPVDVRLLILLCVTPLIGILAGALVVHCRVPQIKQGTYFDVCEQQFRGRTGTLAICAGGVNVEGQTFHAFYEWLHFHDLIQTGNHLFLYYTQKHALIIPRTAFTSDQAFLDFARACRDYFETVSEKGAEPVDTTFTMKHPRSISSSSEEFTNDPRT